MPKYAAIPRCYVRAYLAFFGHFFLKSAKKFEAPPTPKGKVTMSLQLSIKVPVFDEPLRSFRLPCRALKPKHYANWTPNDYKYVYSDANDTPYTWNDVIVTMRRPKRIQLPQATKAK